MHAVGPQAQIPGGAATSYFGKPCCSGLSHQASALLPCPCRARCELVCRHWLATSRNSATLWRAVKWSSQFDWQLLQLRWLGRHALVQRAQILLCAWRPDKVPRPCKVIPAALSTLVCWAPSLQRVSLCFTELEEDWLNVLGGLRQLTWLHLWVELTEPPRAALTCLSSLCHLRTLHYKCIKWRGTNAEQELPLLPTSLEHLWVSGRLQSRNALGRLTALQTLVCSDYPSRLPSLHGLGALTALVLYNYGWDLPPGLSTLTSLRYFKANFFRSTPPHVISLEELCHLPQLKWLCLRHSGVAELPSLMPASLRMLDVRKSHAVIPPHAVWLATLEQLGCSCPQVSMAGAVIHMWVLHLPGLPPPCMAAFCHSASCWQPGCTPCLLPPPNVAA